MSSKFNAYEIIGVLAPGSTILFGLALIFPELKAIFFDKGFSLGDLGLFTVLAFVAGHLVQAVGNAFEKLFWKPFGGMPTDWYLKDPTRLLDTSQIDRMGQILNARFNLGEGKPANWPSIIRELYADIHEAGRSERIDSFNRVYGLMRGVTSSLLVVSACAILQSSENWKAAALLLVAAVLSGYRMHRFGRLYGRELLVEYLRLNSPAEGDAKTT